MKKKENTGFVNRDAGFREAFSLMNDAGENVFLTGRAGTGKSTLVEYFRRKSGKNTVVLAPTGVAALNAGGETIHSFFGFGPGITLEKAGRAAGARARLYREMDVLVIDEISMVRADLLDCVDRFLRVNGREPDRPFGGVQTVLAGDPYQLPPVVASREEKEIFSSHYSSEHFFDSRVYSRLSCRVVELKEVYRQSDAGFVRLLDGIRLNSVSDADLEVLNGRVGASPAGAGGRALYLASTNRIASEINRRRMAALPGVSFSHEAVTEGECPGGRFPADERLTLKPGAQVMLLNNDAAGRWVNGTLGSVREILRPRRGARAVRVDIAGSAVDILPHGWKFHEYVYNGKRESIETKESGYFEQYPLKPAWAITIHKSQGKTFESVVIDTGSGVFAPGQMYVALSRCTSLRGISLRKKARRSDLFVDERVVRFLRCAGIISDGMACSV